MDPAEPTATLGIDDDLAKELIGTRFALVALDDPQLIASLKRAGAEQVAIEQFDALNSNEAESDNPESNWVIIESASIDPIRLREQLGELLVARLAAGDVHLLERQQVESLLQQDRNVRRLYTVAMLADLLQVPVATIRGWHRRGLIQPVNSISKLAYFDFNEVLAAKQLATLVLLGVQPNSIQKSLDQMARWLPETDRSLSRVSMLVDGHRLLLKRGGRLVEPGGQQRFNFDVSGADAHNGLRVVGDDAPDIAAEAACGPAMILPFEIASEDFSSLDSPPTDPAAMLNLAERLEEQADLAEAIETYRSLHLAFGPAADTCLRLGELLYRTGQVAAARERYSVAVELDPQLVEARAALGCVLAEMGETELAIAAFQGALSEHPHYTEVHFQLARALQKTERGNEALVHWQRFLQLDPEGIWAEEARAQVDDLLAE